MQRPFGPIGLLLSLIAIAAIALFYLVPPLAVVVLFDAISRGPAHLVEAVGQTFRAGAQGSLNTVEIRFFILGALVYAAVVAAIVTVAKWRAGADWPGLVALTPWSPLRAGWRYWGLVACGLVYGFVASATLGLLRPDLRSIDQLPTGPAGIAVSFLLAVVCAPIAEEALFRGWIYTSLRSRFGFAPSNLVSAAVFALAHWEKTHLYALVIFPLGLLMGLVRERSGSIRASAFFHALYNGFALTLTVLAMSQRSAGAS